MMFKRVLFLICALVSVQAFGFEDFETNEPIQIAFDGDQYSPSEIEVKRAVIKAFLAYHWEIDKHERFILQAVYKNKCTAEATITGAKVVFAEIEGYKCATFRKSWLKSLGNAYMQYIEIGHHVRKAQQLIETDNK